LFSIHRLYKRRSYRPPDDPRWTHASIHNKYKIYYDARARAGLVLQIIHVHQHTPVYYSINMLAYYSNSWAVFRFFFQIFSPREGDFIVQAIYDSSKPRWRGAYIYIYIWASNCSRYPPGLELWIIIIIILSHHKHGHAATVIIIINSLNPFRRVNENIRGAIKTQFLKRYNRRGDTRCNNFTNARTA